MSNVSGTGPASQPGATAAPEGELPEPEVADSDPVTEVIDVGAATNAEPGEAGADEERRFTAPGFDAGSTQIIDRVPDPPTELIPTSAEAAETFRERTAPQEIPAGQQTRPRWLWPVVALVVVLALVAGLGWFLLHRSSTTKARNSVRATIESFDAAVRDGDLATLRTITCGQTKETYATYDQQAWSDTYSKVRDAKQYPVVASIDEVVVNGDHAEANVTSYLAYDPATTSTRSFDLQYSDDQWKICQAS